MYVFTEGLPPSNTSTALLYPVSFLSLLMVPFVKALNVVP